MKYFLDTEFLEGKQDKRFLGIKYGETKPTIDLISIGIVSEDNREYYAISKDFNLKEAWNRNDLDPNHKRNYKQKDNYWIRENVLKPIFEEMRESYMQHEYVTYLNSDYKNFNYSNFKALLFKYGKTNKQIADEIKLFTMQYSENKNEIWDKPKFYGYFSDYDWVVFCWLFGKMMDLPKGFPMYCKDLKQMLDEKENSLKNEDGTIELVSEIIPEHGCAMVGHFKSIKDFGTYPKQTNEHNALEDAKWNFRLYNFLKRV